MSTEEFYKNLDPLGRFFDVSDFSKYVPVPDDWFVIITDIKGSTVAVSEGRYKEVNAVGAASIIAVLNIAKDVDIPFVFGGDGATMLIPPSLVEPAKGALVAARKLAHDYFKMELRVGMVPISDIPKDVSIRVAKFRASPHYFQAMFCGNGIAAAEKLVKSEETSAKYEIPTTIKSNGLFKGFECRWNDIASPHGETVSILVKVLSGDIQTRSSTYNQIFAKIEEIYGTEADYHPITSDALHLVTETPHLNTETYIRAGHKKALARFWYKTKIWLTDLYVNWAMTTNRTKNDFNLAIYKSLLVATCDYRKFDDALRMVIAGTEDMRKQLQEFLSELHNEGKIAYGIHATDRALMTCLVFERYGKQVHFIDGADGGYTAASKPFKEQLKNLNSKK
ncbi:MAG: DUF3095 domain-containing protein [Candidatus Vogelbacteria bacterium]|nr:DUF3095 domain-containing protein [Candidatus Vogelbacteria bacterium]